MYMRKQEFCRCYSCDGVLYQVRRGDTLYSISRRFAVALEDLMDANPFINVYRLEPGMQVCVPVPETEGGESLGEDGRNFGDERFDDGGRSFEGEIFDRKSFEGRGFDEKSFDGKGFDGTGFDGRSFDERSFSGSSDHSGRRGFDEGRRVAVKRGTEDCPYGLCADPMRFDGSVQ